MNKKVLLLTLMFSLCLGTTGKAGSAQQEQDLYINFDKISVLGHVFDESQQPLGGIKVEIRLAYDGQRKKPEIMGAAELQENVWEFLYRTLGTNVFGWAETDKEGFYQINGVPRPGAYFLLVRHTEDYLQTKAPIIIHASGAKEFEVDLILRERGSPSKTISKEAMGEIAAAKEAVAGKNLDKAVKHFRKAIEIEPEFAEAHYNLGILLRQKGKVEVAKEHFLSAIEYQEDYPLALFSLGEILHAQKKYARSNQYLIKYLENLEPEKNRTTALAHYMAGANYFNLRKADKAIPYLSQALELEPKINPNAYLFLANSYVFERDGENAIKCYRKFIELYPDAPNIQQVKAILEKLESMYSPEKK